MVRSRQVSTHACTQYTPCPWPVHCVQARWLQTTLKHVTYSHSVLAIVIVNKFSSISTFLPWLAEPLDLYLHTQLTSLTVTDLNHALDLFRSTPRTIFMPTNVSYPGIAEKPWSSTRGIVLKLFRVKRTPLPRPKPTIRSWSSRYSNRFRPVHDTTPRF